MKNAFVFICCTCEKKIIIGRLLYIFSYIDSAACTTGHKNIWPATNK